MRTALIIALLLPLPAMAQSPARHPFSGMSATASSRPLDRAWPRPAGPRFGIDGMQANRLTRIYAPFRLLPQSPGIIDEYDLIYFGNSGIHRIRLKVSTTGRPLSQRWTDALLAYFRYLDRDGDGTLNAFEGDTIYSNKTMQKLLTAGVAVPAGNDPPKSLADLDRDRDGRVSTDEFLYFYQPSATALIGTIIHRGQDEAVERLDRELFNLLDRDRDGKLSRTELRDAPELIARFDRNDDECIAALEMFPGLFNTEKKEAPAEQSKPAPATEAVQLVPVNTAPDDLVERIITRYDNDRNLRLSKSECTFDAATFAKLDTNGDGELSIGELPAWKDLPPEAAYELMQAGLQDDCIIRSIADGKALGERGNAMLRAGADNLNVSVRLSTGMTNDNPTALFNFNEVANDKGHDYITEAHIAGPRYQLIRIQFDMIDRDGDGRMTRAEFDRYRELQNSFRSLPITLTATTRPPNLFSLLDASGDGRLSRRELLMTEAALGKLRPEGSTEINRQMLRPQAAVECLPAVQGSGVFSSSRFEVINITNANGPLWFQRMDRNSDGDISRTEFPGRATQFDQLDTDHDGLISLDEAKAAESKFRKP